MGIIPQVNSAGDAKLLRRMINERKGKVQQRSGLQTAYDTWDAPGLSIPARKLPALRAYVVVPKETIPGARLVDNQIVMGSGIACLMERDVEGSAGSNSETLKASTWDSGSGEERVEVTVYNLCQEAIEPDTSQGSHECDVSCNDIVLFCVQDMNGDLFIVKECDLPSCSSSSSMSSASSSSQSSQSSSSASESSSESSSGSSQSGSESASGSTSTSDSISGSVSASDSVSGSASESGSTSDSVSGSVSNSLNSISGSVSNSFSNSFSGSLSRSTSFSGSMSDGSVSHCNFVDSLTVITGISCTDTGIEWTDGTLFWVGDAARPATSFWGGCCGGHLCFEEGEGGECDFAACCGSGSTPVPSLASVQTSEVIASLGSGVNPSVSTTPASASAPVITSEEVSEIPF